MTQYEYKYRSVPLTDEQKQLVHMNMAKVEDLHEIMLKIVNEEGGKGWEALYPFLVDAIWFRRIKGSAKRSTKK